jgi:hypothetical protein
VDSDKNQPHVFEDVYEIPMVPPAGVTGSEWNQLPVIPGRESTLCRLCHAPRGDRLHIEGEAEADGESPNWG